MGDNVLAHDKVLYHGHAVAAVAATSLDIAREAADADRRRVRSAAAGDDARRGDAPDAPILHDDLVTKGQPARRTRRRRPTSRAHGAAPRRLDKGFAEADVVVEREFQTPMVHQGYIEPHACVARYGAGRPGARSGASTQGPFVVRDCCAGILGIDAAKIKVIPSEIGGGFGGKIPVYLEPVAVVLSRKAHGR